MSTIIKLRCLDQVLTFESTPTISSGGRGENFVEFSFCSLWDNFAKTAVFWRTEDDVYHAVLDRSNRCEIPPEVTVAPGAIHFGVFGVSPDGCRRTSEMVRYTVDQGAYSPDSRPSEATPDVYDQLMARYAETLEALNPTAGLVAEAAAAAAAAEAALAEIEAEVNEANTAAMGAATAATHSRDAAYAAQAAAANAVPPTRKVNGKPLSGDITLTAEDVGATAFGSYIGSGSAAGRTIDTGTKSNLMFIWALDEDGGLLLAVFVTAGALLIIDPYNENFDLMVRSGATFVNGVLTVKASNNKVNLDGVVYHYQVL